jgi:5-oxoprolinase (ATP-hydrolysing)
LCFRAHTACAAAYLTPVITNYLSGFLEGFDDSLRNGSVPLAFLQSDGGLSPYHSFGGHQAILSGPAGGVVGYAKTTPSLPVIGFDMGGTSTDVSRYDGTYDHVLETVTAGVVIQAPQLDISTVAAGGGSRLGWQHGMLQVGPESAGAHPGPVCYRKGGPLAVTDANVILGRVLPQEFPSIFGPDENQPLHVQGSRDAMEELRRTYCPNRTLEELAYGYLQVANEAMCRPIRNLTQMKGFDITIHTLACFGGAGPQHACAMAKALGMSRVFIHRFGGVLSAYGLSMADAVQEEQEPTAQTYTNANLKDRNQRLERLEETARSKLIAQGYNPTSIVVDKYLHMRYEGTDNAILIADDSPNSTYGESFVRQYQREFGFVLEGRGLVVDDCRVRARVPGASSQTAQPTHQYHKEIGLANIQPPTPSYQHRAYFENGWQDVPVYKMDELLPGQVVGGPSIIVQAISTIVLEVDCHATVTMDGDLDITVKSKVCHGKEDGPVAFDIDNEDGSEIEEDPVQLSIFSHRFMGIAEQMGRTLARTAISVNMKERLDFSCALFTANGGLVANAPHIPVHLGAMQAAVSFQVDYWKDKEGIQEGDVLVSNHPQLAGGSHLPDITVITPVFHQGKIIFFVASRGHHADIGGISPGSMPPHSKCLEDEGAMIVAFKLVRGGEFQEKGITEILQSPGNITGNCGTRNLRDNISDLKAQIAANHSGIRLLHQLVLEYSFKTVYAYMRFIQSNAEVAVREMLMKFAKEKGTTLKAVDYMDDGSPIALTISINADTGSAMFDFTGTGPQVLANHNAPPAVTYSAVIYSLRSLVNQDIPLNQGCLAPIEFIIPKYTILNPSDSAAVVGGNVLTSQRVVDVILLAFGACAASQGCMNNLTFGDSTFGYYETIAGGAGAGPTWEGTSGVHTHCTNTRITDPEILERRYPVWLHQFSLRQGSGGAGKHCGGNGVIRELEPTSPLTVSILSERRTLRPYGMAGGEDGATGRNLLIQPKGIMVNLGGRCTTDWKPGETLRIETPGGGGYGPKHE